MIIIPENTEDVFKLANWYNQGRITAEIYWDAMDRYAQIQIEKEIKNGYHDKRARKHS